MTSLFGTLRLVCRPTRIQTSTLPLQLGRGSTNAVTTTLSTPFPAKFFSSLLSSHSIITCNPICLSISRSAPLPLHNRPSALYLAQQVSFFSKYISKARKKRLPMTTKRVGRGFSKGNGAKKEGIITSKGKFIRVPEKCTELQVPDLTGFKLKAYIAPGLKRNLH